MTTKGTPGRVVRIDDETWAAYGELCKEEGTSRADDLRRHAHSRVAKWRAKKYVAGLKAAHEAQQAENSDS
ncbi:hypothetical protein [Streptomyces sp. NPDC054887]